MIDQIPGGAGDVEQLICDGKTLRRWAEPTSSGGPGCISKK
jgi:hypothetical protein